MSSKPLQVELPTGEVIWARVTVDRPQNIASSGLQHIDVEDLSRTVHGVSSVLRQAVNDLAPDEIEVGTSLRAAVRAGRDQ